MTEYREMRPLKDRFYRENRCGVLLLTIYELIAGIYASRAGHLKTVKMFEFCNIQFESCNFMEQGLFYL